MDLIGELKERWKAIDYPILTIDNKSFSFSDFDNSSLIDLKMINKGDVVALVGDFEPQSIVTLLRLIDLGTIIVPLTKDTKNDHDYFFKSAGVDILIEDGKIDRIRENQKNHNYLNILREEGKPGLVLFSSGTTGKPKAILHDFTAFLKRFENPRPTLKTLNFLLFDHIGGLNTLFHTIFNRGHVVATKDRNVENILSICAEYKIELLPTTPTFLRLLLLSGYIPDKVPESLKIITYGTERMDQSTLSELCKLLPKVDFRQTFGMSELGIMRVKSKARDSLFMQIGGEGTETKIRENVLYIKNKNRMIGYLNAPSPFNKDGWYNTKDIVESDGTFIRVIGRDSEVINVGGQKFMASEVERAALENQAIDFIQVHPKDNPITGQHIEVTIQLKEGSKENKSSIKSFFIDRMPKHMRPQKITFSKVHIGHRFKKI